MSVGSCLVCGEAPLDLVLDLGSTAPANNFIVPAAVGREPEPTFPLRVGLCRSCGHVQLVDRVPPGILFDHYLYMSSASSTLTAHLHGLARTVIERAGLESADLVVDIGCNDGTLLKGFGLAGIDRRVGVDPAANLAATARGSGAEVITAYFTPEIAASIRAAHGKAAAITMTNTFPHIHDLSALLRSIDHLLVEEGVFVLEAHYLVDLMAMRAFDTVYHEHVSYWSLKPMVGLFAAHGFEVIDVERLPIHHGQIRVWVCRRGVRPVSERVGKALEEERALGLDQPEPYRQLARQIQTIKSELTALIRDVQSRGGRVVGYGAPAKGNTLLSICGLGPSALDYIADASLLKQGRITPGTHIPIEAPSRIFADRPEVVIVLAWNFVEEIAEQLAPYVSGGGRLVVPIPEVRDIGSRG